MNQIIKSIIVYIFTTLALGFIWNMFLFPELYRDIARSAYRGGPIVQLGMLAVFLEAIAMSIIFNKFYKNDGIWKAVGLSLGVGIFSITYASLVVSAKFIIEPVWLYISLELTFGILHYGLIGILLSKIHK